MLLEEQELGPLFEEVAAAWWQDVQLRVKTGTLTCYRPRYHDALNRFSGRRMTEIDPSDISEFFRFQKKQGRAHKTVVNSKIVLSQIWQLYIDSPKWRGKSNPVALTKVPTGLTKTTREPPSDAAIEKIKQSTDGIGLLANVVLYTGIRLGEANGIQVKDIDLNKTVYGITGGIYIHQAYVWRGNKPYLESPKTAAGVRWVPIFEPLYPLIEAAIRNLQPTDFLISGCSEPLSKMQFQRRWDSYCNSLGLCHVTQEPYKSHGRTKKEDGTPYMRTIMRADVTPHQFRHYLATMCYEAQIPELVAQKILGHADISTTHRVYTHIRDRMMDQSAVKLNDLFTQNSRK